MNTRNLDTGKYVAFADIRKQAEGKPDALAVEREVQQMERRPCFAECGKRFPSGMVVLENGEAFVVHAECLERLKVS